MISGVERHESGKTDTSDLFYVNVSGYNIACHRKGQGEPMLYVHGITTYSFIWGQVIQLLSGAFDTIALDLLGCGDSDKPVGVDYSLIAQADIVKEIIRELELEKVHLVCHDIGGGIGQILAVKYPGLVSDLVLINTVGYDYWPVQPIITFRIPFIRQLAMAALDVGAFKSLIRRAFFYKEKATDELMALFWKPMKTREGRQGFLQLARDLDNKQLLAISEELRNLQMPVLIIRGEADPFLDAEISERLHRDIKNSVLKRVPTGGHFIQIDEPDIIVRMIHDFINGKDI